MRKVTRHTVLMRVGVYASHDGHSDVVKLLLAKGADVNTKDEVDFAALML